MILCKLGIHSWYSGHLNTAGGRLPMQICRRCGRERAW